MSGRAPRGQRRHEQDEDAVEAEFFALVGAGLPEWTYVHDPVSRELLDWAREQFRGSRWEKPLWLSHRRILCRDEHKDPFQVVDWWGPDELVSAAEAAGATDAQIPDLIEPGLEMMKPCRVVEWVELFEPGPEERALLDLDQGAAAFSVTRRYLNLRGDPILVQHRWVRVGTVLRFDRNLLWERAFTRGLFPAEFPDSEASGCCGGGR